MRRLAAIFAFGAAATLAAGCGAPVKSASEVASLFAGDATTLQQKVSDLCGILAARDAEPTLKNTNIPYNDCADVGLAAQNLTDIERFGFLGLDSGKKEDDVIRFALRTEVWLNRDLIDLASVASDLMKKKKAEGGGKGILDLPEGGVGKAGGPIKLAVKITKEPKFDLAEFAFGMELNFKADGIILADNTIAIDGKLIDNKIAAHVRTLEDQPFEKSILKSLEALFIATPHAGDVYVDVFLDMQVHSLGVGDEAIKSKVQDLMSSYLKTAIDGLLNLKKKEG